MADGLYDTDILAWAEQQAGLLRRAAAGERVNGLDWPNLIEEIEDLGRSELRAVESLLAQALAHLLKAAGWPHDDSAGHWRAEALAFLRRAARLYRPGMRQYLDLAAQFEDAVLAVRLDRMGGQPPGRLPDACPLTLEELLGLPTDTAHFVARIRAAVTPESG
jgi:hypothetical protein